MENELNYFSCRLCGSCKRISNLIKLENFPKAAQFLPEKSEFFADIPITLSVVECGNCGLVQLANEPVSYFKDVITAASLSEQSKYLLKA